MITCYICVRSCMNSDDVTKEFVFIKKNAFFQLKTLFSSAIGIWSSDWFVSVRLQWGRICVETADYDNGRGTEWLFPIRQAQGYMISFPRFTILRWFVIIGHLAISYDKNKRVRVAYFSQCISIASFQSLKIITDWITCTMFSKDWIKQIGSKRHVFRLPPLNLIVSKPKCASTEYMVMRVHIFLFFSPTTLFYVSTFSLCGCNISLELCKWNYFPYRWTKDLEF